MSVEVCQWMSENYKDFKAEVKKKALQHKEDTHEVDVILFGSKPTGLFVHDLVVSALKTFLPNVWMSQQGDNDPLLDQLSSQVERDFYSDLIDALVPIITKELEKSGEMIAWKYKSYVLNKCPFLIQDEEAKVKEIQERTDNKQSKIIFCLISALIVSAMIYLSIVN